MSVPVRVFSRCLHALIRNLICTFFTCDPGKIDFMFLLFRVDHDEMNKVFINTGGQALKANRAEKIDLVTFAEFQPGMFNAGIIPNFGM